MRREVAHLKRLDQDRDKRYEEKFDEALQQALADQERRLHEKFDCELQKDLAQQRDKFEQ